jgi:GntR family transcriptional regulator/MocR family aminotransferase
LRIASLTDFLLMRMERGADGAKAAKGAGVPLNRQIYQAIREAILSQLLPSGWQLPSSRDLARELAISRNTVTYAYEQLIAEGYLPAPAPSSPTPRPTRFPKSA